MRRLSLAKRTLIERMSNGARLFYRAGACTYEPARHRAPARSTVLALIDSGHLERADDGELLLTEKGDSAL